MARPWRDPITGKTYAGEAGLLEAMERDSSPQLSAWGVTARQAAYNCRNGLPAWNRSGKSVISGRPTMWNERAGRYDRFADDGERQQYRQQFLDRMRRVHGKDHLLDDPEQQRRMLAARSISGTYTFADGSERGFVGQEERAFLEFMDKGLGWPGRDIESPAPQVFSYTGEDGKPHVYLPDFYVSSLNLIVEVKGEMHNGWRNRDFAIEHTKDTILGTSGYNYVKVESRSYYELLDEIARIQRGDGVPGT